MQRQTSLRTRSQHGAALLIFALVLISALLGGFLSQLNSTTQANQRDQLASEALARAKDALIGFAITYRDTHPDEVFGYLPCPDTDNDGVSDSCGATDVSLVGRLPWKTLGVPPLRDATAECLWYAVSGRAKDSPKTASFNWDTLGQFVVQDPAGTTLAGVNAHERPLAVVYAPRAALAAQSRTPAGVSECGGSNDPAAYLEGVGALSTGDTTLVLSSAESARNGTNNDQGLWITGREIFERINRRSDFETDIKALVEDLASCLNNLPSAGLPSTSAGNKGIDNVLDPFGPCPVVNQQKANVRKNWRDNLLYTGGPSGSFTINGSSTSCRALLLFSGERTTRTIAPLAAQTRSTIAEKGDIANFGDASMYLEGANASLFPMNGAYSAATQYSAESASADVVRCINGLGSGTASFANPSDFASFTPVGAAVTPDATTNPADPMVSIADALGLSGGCFWFPNLIPLAGKTLRAYYDFQFFYADTSALPTGSGSDRGNGFTFQVLSGDVGAPNACGKEINMGVLKPLDGWLYSFIIETDIRKDVGNADPVGNHTAIMTNGTLDHTLAGKPGSACNGTTNGCLHSPSNKFEESPTPLLHNQRIEIHTGCNPGCSTCKPTNHAAPNTYARISTWVDCTDCNDVVADLNRDSVTGGQAPIIFRCEDLNTPAPNLNVLNSVYVGFTGGFRSGASAQGVAIKNFSLRSD